MNFPYLYFFFIILLISCSDLNFPKSQITHSNSKHLKGYDYYIKQGKLDSARIFIDSLYKDKPNEKKVLTKRGEVYFLLNDFEVAEKSWLDCILIDVKNEECYEKLIGLYCGVYDLMEYKCRDVINKALKVNQNNQIALFFEAKRFVEKNKIKEAIDLFEDLVRIDSNNLRVLNELAVLYDTNYKSEFYYNKMLEIDTSYVSFYGLGMYFQKKGLFKKAIENYKKGLSLNQTKESHYNIGYCFLMMNLEKKAIDSFSQAINLDASYLEAYFARGYSYSKLKQNQFAIEDYKFCLMLEPGFEDARIQLEKLK